jgi:hypothetical protein
VVILSARIAAERRVLVPVRALVEVEVGAAHSAVEVRGGGGCGLRGLHGLHGCLVLSFYYFSLPYPLANFFFNFLNFKSMHRPKKRGFPLFFISFNCVLFIVIVPCCAVYCTELFMCVPP